MRRRMLVLVGATTSLILIAFLVPLALLLRTVAADRAVQAATVEAQSLSSLVATTDRAALALAVQQLDATSPGEITLFLADGSVLGAPAGRSGLVELGALGRSESAVVAGGREIVYAVRDRAGGAGVIRTFVPDAELSRGVGRAWLLLGALGVGLLGLSLAVADRLGRSFVRATTDLAVVSHRLAGGRLDARADRAAPAELGVVADALNGLAARITGLLREERESVADLAHRVRTPLTALRLEAEALPPEHGERIGAAVDAVQRSVTQAIELARRRGSGQDAARAGSDAAAVVRERVAFWAVLAEDTDRDVAVEIVPEPLPVALGAADLGACVDALLGNVFAHTPDGTAFAVRLGPRAGGGARLVVADAGPGLPAGSTALSRGSSGANSTGLGLDIARRSAEQDGGRLVLGRAPEGGLEVVVELAPPGP